MSKTNCRSLIKCFIKDHPTLRTPAMPNCSFARIGVIPKLLPRRTPQLRRSRWTIPLSTPWRQQRESATPLLGRNGKFVHRGGALNCQGSLGSVLMGIGLFLMPGALFCMYALVTGKGDLGHGMSVALTQISRGYFQPELGGSKVPVCDGKFSDLMSNEPLFCFLYEW